MLDKLLTLFAALAEWLRRWDKTQEQAEHDKAHGEIEKSPGDWFDSHFNGSGGDSGDDGVQHNTAVPNNAADASQTDPAERGSYARRRSDAEPD